MITLALAVLLGLPDPRILPSLKLDRSKDVYVRCGWTQLEHGMARYVDCKAHIVCVVQDERVVACFSRDGHHL